ncbi:MAG: hypothetical protein AABX54_05050 [Nanoarchaeota archaeon]
MGKNRTIKNLADLMAGMIAHRILTKYTNKPESIHHMESEINNYREIISNFRMLFNWNSDDKKRIFEETRKSLEKELKKEHFRGVKFPSSEKEKILNEIMKEMFE